jgi:hypothetical protein
MEKEEGKGLFGNGRWLLLCAGREIREENRAAPPRIAEETLPPGFKPPVHPLMYRFSLTRDGLRIQERIQLLLKSLKGQVLSSLRMGNDQSEVPILGRIGGIREDLETRSFLADLSHHLPRVSFLEVEIDEQEVGVEFPEELSKERMISRAGDGVSILRKFLGQEFSNFSDFTED